MSCLDLMEKRIRKPPCSTYPIHSCRIEAASILVFYLSWCVYSLYMRGPDMGGQYHLTCHV